MPPARPVRSSSAASGRAGRPSRRPRARREPDARGVEGRPALRASRAADLLEREWGIRGALRPLPSERDQNFRVDQDGTPRYVLKLSNRHERPGVLDMQAEGMARLERAGVPCPVVVPGRDGASRRRVDGVWARVLRYVDGTLWSQRPDHPPPLLRDLGRTMGRVTRAWSGFLPAAAHRRLAWDVRRAGAVLSGHGPDVVDRATREVVGRVRRRVVEELMPALARLPHSVVHNDANENNLLVRDGAIAGLLDFGDMVHSVTANEAAVAGAYAMLGSSDPVRAAGLVVAGYVETWPLSPEERRWLPDLIHARLATSVALSGYQRRLAPGDPYLRVSESMVERALADLERAGGPGGWRLPGGP